MIAYNVPAPDGGEELRLIAPDGTRQSRVDVASLTTLLDPVWSRDGSRLAVTAPASPSGPLAVWTIAPDGSAPVRITDSQWPFTVAAGTDLEPLFKALSPGLVNIVINLHGTRDATLPPLSGPATGLDVSTVVVQASDQQPFDWLIDRRSTTAFAGWGIDWAPGEAQLVTPEPASRTQGQVTTALWMLPVEPGAAGQSLERQLSSPNSIRSPVVLDLRPAFAPDGARIAFVRSLLDGQGHAESRLMVDDLAGTEHLIAAFPNEVVGGVSWSGDGRWLAFDRGPADAIDFIGSHSGTIDVGAFSIWIINVDGTGLRELVKDGNAPSWSWQ
jgi:hypothetical protein